MGKPGWHGDRKRHSLAAKKGWEKRKQKSGKIKPYLEFRSSSGTFSPEAGVNYEFEDPKRLGPAELDEVGVGTDLKGPFLKGKGGIERVKASGKIRTTGELEINDLDIKTRSKKKIKKESRKN